jgi:hypothetical protein
MACVIALLNCLTENCQKGYGYVITEDRELSKGHSQALSANRQVQSAKQRTDEAQVVAPEGYCFQNGSLV